jgi:thiol:disulfide interchange protein DsbD
VKAQGYVSARPVPAGEPAQAAVVLTVREGWHVNAHEPPLDYLIGTTLDLTAPEDFDLNAPSYPAPKRLAFDFARDSLDVYAGCTPIFLSLRAHADSDPGPHPLTGTVRVQACNDQTCLRPATISVEIPVEVGAADAEAQPIHENLFHSPDS